MLLLRLGVESRKLSKIQPRRRGMVDRRKAKILAREKKFCFYFAVAPITKVKQDPAKKKREGGPPHEKGLAHERGTASGLRHTRLHDNKQK